MPNYEEYIGKEISKRSGKPFKSGKKIGIPTSITTNAFEEDELAFNMDDGSIVSCKQCLLVIDAEVV
jgi:hypothetical protein